MKNLILFTFIITMKLHINAQTVTDIDGNIYNTVTIGTQTWMVENLKTTRYNDGDSIPYVTDGTDWSARPAYCWYDNNVSNKDTYGALYTWYTVNTGKLAPTGWHIPTDDEWTTLGNYLIANGFNYDGTTTGSAYAKALASATGWSSDNGVGTVGNTDYPAKRNATGFTALPGGYRDDDGTFNFSVSSCNWWSATEYMPNYAWYRHMYSGVNHVARISSGYEESGFSVRCVSNNNSSITNSINNVDMIFYPNPATERLNLKNITNANTLIMIFDLHGKQVLSKQIDSNIIDISNLKKGIYVLKLVDSDKAIITKFIKE